MTQVLIQTSGFELTEALQKTCEKSSQKIFKLDPAIQRVEFFLEKEGKGDDQAYTAKIKVNVPGKDMFLAESRSDMYEAIREVCKKGRVNLGKTRDEKMP